MSPPKSSLGAVVEDIDSAHVPPGAESLAVSSIAINSKHVKPGCLFFAIAGAKQDGAAYLAEAQRSGAVAAVCTPGVAVDSVPGLPLIPVPDVRAVLAKVCARFYDFPSRRLMCVGVTGTNGKTSVTWILAQAFRALGKPAALCGTLGLGIAGDSEPLEFESSPNTTVDASVLQEFLARAVKGGAAAAAIEATSQALVQHRTKAIDWDVALFTNLTRDHLDLHGTMERYGEAKLILFREQLAESTKQDKLAVLNMDDPFSAEIRRVLQVEQPQIRIIEYSTQSTSADSRIEKKSGSLGQTILLCRIAGQEVRIHSRLIGEYNVSNLLGAATVLIGKGFAPSAVSAALESVPPVPGRLEVVATNGFSVVVDYAHSPDGLVQAQRSLRPLTEGRLITVFGCGGDRDRGKRPLMGEAVAQLADLAVVTSDNPRSENPEQILDDILPGLSRTGAREGFSVSRVVDRREAIRAAFRLAKVGDVVLVAGKGHEDYQEIAGTRYPFSDKEVCRELLSELQ